MKENRKPHFAGRVISFLLAFCMTMALWPVMAFAEEPATVKFTCQSQMITGGSIFYKLDDAAEFTKVSEENDQYNVLSLGDGNNKLTVKFVPNSGYQLDAVRGVILRVNGSKVFQSTATDIAGFTSDEGYTFDLSALVREGSVSASSFELEFGFESAGGSPGPGPEPGDTPAHGGYVGEQKTAAVTVTGQADFYLNDSPMVNSTGGSHEVTYAYNDSGTVDFYFTCFINQRITALEINGKNYYDKLPTPDTETGRAALLAACKGQINEFKITVPYNESGYTIVTSIKDLGEDDADYMVVGNFLWTYTDQNQGDDYLDHGHMELLGVRYNGKDYLPDELNNPGTGLDWGESNGNGGAVLPVGSEVTVKLVPEYGYQLTSFGINGGDFGTGDAQSTFTFQIKPGNAHLGAHFTPVEDKVTSTADVVSEGSIKLGENEIDTGSVVLSVDDAVNVNEGGFQNAVEQETGTPGYEVASVVDINLNQVIYKGTENDVWSNEMRELDSPAEITLKLDGNYTDPVVVHEKHDGTYEVLDTTYDAENGTITFETRSFSNYAIAVPSKGNVTNAENNACHSDLTDGTDDLIRNLLTEEEQQRLDNGAIVKFWLTATDHSESVTQADKDSIDSKKGNATIGMYLDISLWKQIDGAAPITIPEPNNAVTITLRVPDSLINSNASVTRTYQIIRLHNGEVTVLPCSYDPVTKTISFKSAQFSIYALAYVDQQNLSNGSHTDNAASEATPAPVSSTIPKTGDAGTPTLWLILALASGIGTFYFGKKRFAQK